MRFVNIFKKLFRALRVIGKQQRDCIKIPKVEKFSVLYFRYPPLDPFHTVEYIPLPGPSNPAFALPLDTDDPHMHPGTIISLDTDDPHMHPGSIIS